MMHSVLKVTFHVSISTLMLATAMSASVGYNDEMPLSPEMPYHDQELRPSQYDIYPALPVDSLYVRPMLQYGREMTPEVGDQYWREEWSTFRERDPPTWLPEQQHYFPTSSLTEGDHQNSMSTQKRSSTLNEVIRRLMAMQGHSFYRGRATRMRFGAGRRK